MNKDLQIVRQWNLQPGDGVVIPKSLINLVQHHALYLGYDDSGNHYMCENMIGFGVKLTRVQDYFAYTGQITRIERYLGSGAERKLLVQRALSKLGKPYNLINYNCESFCNDVRYNTPKSKQVENVFTFIILAGFIFLILGFLFQTFKPTRLS